MNDILARIERAAGIPGLAAILADRLEPADLHSLLLDVYRTIAARRTPATVLKEFLSNRFVRPTAFDPRLLLEWDRVAFASLPETFTPIEIAPLCPLATSSAVAGISQNRSIVTARNLEVISDATNVLALECAVRRRELLKADRRSTESVSLAASHRVIRPQKFANPAWSSHFRLFNLCSAGRNGKWNAEGFRFEAASLLEHIRFHLCAVNTFLGDSTRLHLSLADLWSNYREDFWKLELFDPLLKEFPNLATGFDQERTLGREYYRNACFKIHLLSAGERIELVDGGAVDWMEKLLGDRRERMVISGIGSERVVGSINREA